MTLKQQVILISLTSLLGTSAFAATSTTATTVAPVTNTPANIDAAFTARLKGAQQSFQQSQAEVEATKRQTQHQMRLEEIRRRPTILNAMFAHMRQSKSRMLKGVFKDIFDAYPKYDYQRAAWGMPYLEVNKEKNTLVIVQQLHIHFSHGMKCAAIVRFDGNTLDPKNRKDAKFDDPMTYVSELEGECYAPEGRIIPIDKKTGFISTTYGRMDVLERYIVRVNERLK